MPTLLLTKAADIATALGGFAVAWAQADVARMNATGRHSRLTAWFLKGFTRLSHRS